MQKVDRCLHLEIMKHLGRIVIPGLQIQELSHETIKVLNICKTLLLEYESSVKMPLRVCLNDSPNFDLKSTHSGFCYCTVKLNI